MHFTALFFKIFQQKVVKNSLFLKYPKIIYKQALHGYSENMSVEIKSTTGKLKLMDCQETAELLRIDIKTLYAWMSRKQIPSNLYRKLGRKPVFIYDEVEKWFLAGAEVKKRAK